MQDEIVIRSVFGDPDSRDCRKKTFVHETGYFGRERKKKSLRGARGSMRDDDELGAVDGRRKRGDTREISKNLSGEQTYPAMQKEKG